MKKKYWLIIVGLACFAAVLFWNLGGKPRELTQEEKAQNRVLRDPGAPLVVKALALKNKAKSAYERLMSPELLQEKAAMAEAKRLANWKANFPWKPTHDPALKFDPLLHSVLHAGPNRNGADFYAMEYHTALTRFFQDEMRFIPQFEQFYHIMKEHDRGDHPVLVAEIFGHLWRYHYHSQFDPDEPVMRSDGKPRREKKSSLLGIIPRTKIVTHGEETQASYNSIIGSLTHPEWLNSKFLGRAGRAESEGIANRLINEVKGMENIPDFPDFHIPSVPDEQALMNGEEELLVPYVGWYEKSRMYWAEQQKQFRISYEEGDPSLKEAAPELFPPVDVKNGRLVDKDGDPVKWHEGLSVGLINGRGEAVPVIVAEDGTVNLPTPAEIEVMRERGEIQPAPPEMLDRLPTPPPMPQQAAPPAQAEPAPGLLTPEEQMVIDAIEEVLAE